jgi:predicted dienelactone hydrolase
MRPLELLLGCLIVGAALFSFRKAITPIAVLLSVASLLSALAQMFVEGPRTMAIPLYVAAALLAGSALLVDAVPVRIAITMLAIAGGIAGSIACYAAPIISLPRPDGPFAVGTRYLYLTDPGRKERYGNEKGKPRRFAVQFWYPAAAPGRKTAPYADPRSLDWRTSHLRFIRTHAYPDVSVAPCPPGGFPLVLFSPGAGSSKNKYTYLLEYLASHGYIVMGFDHPDSSKHVAFPDGTVIQGLADGWLDLRSRATLAESTPRTEHLLKTNVEDMQFAMDSLQGAAPDPVLRLMKNAINFSKVAVAGHSFGGAAAAELCRIDSRFATGINMGGWMFSGVNQHGTSKPFLFVVEDDVDWFKPASSYPDTQEGLEQMGTDEYHQTIRNSVEQWGGCMARLRGGSHDDFSDAALYGRTFPWQEKAPVTEMQTAVKKLCLAYLNDHLAIQPGALATALSGMQRSFDYSCKAGPDSGMRLN